MAKDLFKNNSIRDTILRGGVDEYGYRCIQDEIMKDNRKIVLIFSALVGAILAILFVASLFVESLSGFSPLYGCCFLLCALIWAAAKWEGKTNTRLMMADVYLFSFMLLFIGIALGTVLSPLEVSAAFIALLLAVPQVFTDRPWRMYLVIIIADIVFIVLARLYKTPATASSDITNAVVFGLASLALYTYSVRNRVARYFLEYRIRFLAENDQLTGLRNRYCYEHTLNNSIMLNSRSIFCVYIDANGLHELNDTQGHEAGDRMLQYIADVMRNLFGKDDTYRIGGDEFIAMGINRDLASVEKLVEDLKRAVESAGYHVSAGISVREKSELALEQIVREAETKMYDDKADFYRRTGKERRRRSF